MINKAKMVAYLKEHFPECVEEFVEACDLSDYVGEVSYRAYLNNAFHWAVTPSGFKYWLDIAERVSTPLEGEPSPPLAIPDRRDTLLRAAYDLLKECEEGLYVKDVMSTTAIWDEAECDGYCLMEEIGNLLGIGEDD
jgi:hypothetical protein